MLGRRLWCAVTCAMTGRSRRRALATDWCWVCAWSLGRTPGTVRRWLLLDGLGAAGPPKKKKRSKLGMRSELVLGILISLTLQYVRSKRIQYWNHRTSKWDSNNCLTWQTKFSPSRALRKLSFNFTNFRSLFYTWIHFIFVCSFNSFSGGEKKILNGKS